MTVEQLKQIHGAEPFRPFTLHMADGEKLHVPHREFLSQSPAGRTIIVHGEGESFNILDLLLITRIEVDQPASQRSDGNGQG